MSRRSRPTFLVGLLVTLVVMLMTPTTPAQAAESDTNPDLTVSIASLSPSVLKVGSTVTMTGTVTNNDDHPWANVQAYLVIPGSPFTTRTQIDTAIANGNTYTGSRVTEPGTFDTLGDLAPEQTLRFSVKVPYGDLRTSGAEGVYPVGVQILASDVTGERSTDALSRATTFLPSISSTKDVVPASVVWPFLMPIRRGPDGRYTDPGSLLTAVSAGGQLRNLLDLASSTPAPSATPLVDPALLVGVGDISRGRHLPKSFTITDAQKAEADRFLQDLLVFARAPGTWVLDFNRPDVLALAQNADLGRALSKAVDAATTAALSSYQLSGRRTSWPTRNGVTSGLLRALRGNGDSPSIVSSSSLQDWKPSDGSLVKYSTGSGSMPLLVNDVLDEGVPGPTSVVTVRQRILSKAALAVLQRAIDPESRADAVTMVDPSWNPGPRYSEGNLSEAFAAPFTTAVNLDALLLRGLSTYDGRVPTSAKARPLPRAVLQAATQIVSRGAMLSSIIPQRNGVENSLSRDVAGILGVGWRNDPEASIDLATARARRVGAELNKITVKGPPSVTLSSPKGGFPLTITNGTDDAIRIGVSLDSSNPALDLPSVKPIDIDAGERRTLTVQVDLGQQNTTTLSARLTSDQGREIGKPAVFNVRSSKVGTVLWVAMGLAALLVFVALFRRFHRRHSQLITERTVDDDD